MKQALTVLGRWCIMSMILAVMALMAACIEELSPYIQPLLYYHQYDSDPVYRQPWYNQPYQRVNNQYQRRYPIQQRRRVKPNVQQRRVKTGGQQRKVKTGGQQRKVKTGGQRGGGSGGSSSGGGHQRGRN